MKTPVKLWLVTLLLCLPLLLTACVNPYRDPRLGPQRTPGDFALVFTITGHPASDHPLLQGAQYLVEPNRELRVGLGPGAHRALFPQLATVLEPAQYEALFEHIRSHNLTVEPDSPAALEALQQDEPGVTYEVFLRAYGGMHRYRTTPWDSPPTVDLLRRLRGLSRQSVPTDLPPRPQAQVQP